MATITRTQKRYDHRLRELVQKTQDVSCAVQHGAPRSTARGWRTASTAQVVSVDVLDTDMLQMQQEVLRLRTRIQKLIAVLRLLLVVLKISRFSLDQPRLPNGKHKRSLLRVIDRARSALPLRSVLRIIRLSPSRYHRWNRQQQCAFADQPSCPRLTPQQLTPVEVEAIHGTPTLLADAGPENVNGAVDELIHSGLLHRVLARTEITYSNSLIESWWRVLKHQWLCLNTLDTVSAVEKLVRFYVHEHNTRLPHSAFQGQTPDEMYCQNGEHLPQQLEASRQQARQARAEANRKRDCEACELLAASRN